MPNNLESEKSMKSMKVMASSGATACAAICTPLMAFTMFASTAHAVAKKVSAAQSESSITIGDETPISAKLVVDGSSGAKAGSESGEPTSAEAVLVVPENKSVDAKGTESASSVDGLKAAEIAKLPENQIPVLTGNKEAKKASTGGFTRILLTIGILLAAMAAAVFGLKRFAAKKVKGPQGTKIKVLTQHSLGPKKSLAIIQVAGESILIGVTDQNISMLKTLALIDDEFPDDIPRRFENALNDVSEDEEPATTPSRYRETRGSASEPDDFAMRGLSEIRDKVSGRLKNMKNF